MAFNPRCELDRVDQAILAELQRDGRVSYPTGNYKPLHDLLDATPEIVGDRRGPPRHR